MRLIVRKFAHIASAEIDFGDLTVLVGPQATGKSFLLTWLKMGLDSGEVLRALKEAGHDIKEPKRLIDLIFGEGTAPAWDASATEVLVDDASVSPLSWSRRLPKQKDGSVFFIPAHRALLLSEGWPAPFMKLNADTPVVARLFSQNLYQRFSGRKASALFPVSRILKAQYRQLIDDAVFHGGRVDLRNDGLRYQLRLAYQQGAELPFMTWTAGQREFTPLLLGLYHLLPPRKEKKVRGIDWVVVEEPEMGLHPAAITVFMVLVLDLLWRGYKVVLSTHSPLVLDAIWAIQRLAESGAKWQYLSEAFGLGSDRAMRHVSTHALRCTYRVHYLNVESDGMVRSQDISRLDPEAENESEAYWGGLTKFNSQLGKAVRRAAVQSELKL